MPILQYFIWVGAGLLALLFAVEPRLPKVEARTEPSRTYEIRIAAKPTGPDAVTFTGHAVNYGPAPALEVVDLAARGPAVAVGKSNETPRTFAEASQEMSSRPAAKRTAARTNRHRMRSRTPSWPPRVVEAWAWSAPTHAR